MTSDEARKYVDKHRNDSPAFTMDWEALIALDAEVLRLRDACELAYQRKHAVEEELASTQRELGALCAERDRLADEVSLLREMNAAMEKHGSWLDGMHKRVEALVVEWKKDGPNMVVGSRKAAAMVEEALRGSP